MLFLSGYLKKIFVFDKNRRTYEQVQLLFAVGSADACSLNLSPSIFFSSRSVQSLRPTKRMLGVSGSSVIQLGS